MFDIKQIKKALDERWFVFHPLLTTSKKSKRTPVALLESQRLEELATPPKPLPRKMTRCI